MFALYWRFSEKGCNFEIDGLKATWGQDWYWPLMEPIPNKRAAFQFGACVFERCLRSRNFYGWLYLCGTENGHVVSQCFAVDHYFYLNWFCPPFLWLALLFTVMWKLLQSLELFLEDSSLLMLPATRVAPMKWRSASAQGRCVKHLGLTLAGLTKRALWFAGKGLVMGCLCCSQGL